MALLTQLGISYKINGIPSRNMIGCPYFSGEWTSSCSKGFCQNDEPKRRTPLFIAMREYGLFSMDQWLTFYRSWLLEAQSYPIAAVWGSSATRCWLIQGGAGYGEVVIDHFIESMVPWSMGMTHRPGPPQKPPGNLRDDQ